MVCPEFPNDLSLGRRLWTKPATMAMFREEYNPDWGKPTHEVVCMTHKRGIRLYCPMHGDIRIHYSQVIEALRYEDRTTVVAYTEEGKNPIGRAIAGGLVLGPLGAIVGAISGIGTEKVKENDFIVMYLWDAETKKPRSVLVSGRFKEKSFKKFIDPANCELARYRERG